MEIENKGYVILVVCLLITGLIGSIFLYRYNNQPTSIKCSGEIYSPYHLFNLNNESINITKEYRLTEEDLKSGYVVIFNETKCVGQVVKNVCNGAIVTEGKHNVSCDNVIDKTYICYVQHENCTI